MDPCRQRRRSPTGATSAASTSAETWSTSEIRARADAWTLEGDARLLDRLKQFSGHLETEARELNLKLDRLDDRIRRAAVRMANVSTQLLLLSHNKFVESRIYDDGDPAAAFASAADPLRSSSSPPSSPTAEEREAAFLDRLGEAVERGVGYIDKTTSESYSTLLGGGGDPYRARRLPHIIGTAAFFAFIQSEEDVGIGPPDEEARPVRVGTSAAPVATPVPPPEPPPPPPPPLSEVQTEPSPGFAINQVGGEAAAAAFGGARPKTRRPVTQTPQPQSSRHLRGRNEDAVLKGEVDEVKKGALFEEGGGKVEKTASIFEDSDDDDEGGLFSRKPPPLAAKRMEAAGAAMEEEAKEASPPAVAKKPPIVIPGGGKGPMTKNFAFHAELAARLSGGVKPKIAPKPRRKSEEEDEEDNKDSKKAPTSTETVPSGKQVPKENVEEVVSKITDVAVEGAEGGAGDVVGGGGGMPSREPLLPSVVKFRVSSGPRSRRPPSRSRLSRRSTSSVSSLNSSSVSVEEEQEGDVEGCASASLRDSLKEEEGEEEKQDGIKDGGEESAAVKERDTPDEVDNLNRQSTRYFSCSSSFSDEEDLFSDALSKVAERPKEEVTETVAAVGKELTKAKSLFSSDSDDSDDLFSKLKTSGGGGEKS